jgi:zinc transporter ZupT
MGMALLSGATEPLGALMALLFLRPVFEARPWLVGYVMCFVGGIMTGVAVVELIPEARRYRRKRAFNAGFVGGALVMLITMHFV